MESSKEFFDWLLAGHSVIWLKDGKEYWLRGSRLANNKTELIGSLRYQDFQKVKPVPIKCHLICRNRFGMFLFQNGEVPNKVFTNDKTFHSCAVEAVDIKINGKLKYLFSGVCPKGFYNYVYFIQVDEFGPRTEAVGARELFGTPLMFNALDLMIQKDLIEL